MKIRTIITDALQKRLGCKPKAAEKYENAIYNMCKGIYEKLEGDEETEFEDVYVHFSYEKIGELNICQTKDERLRVYNDIKKSITGYRSYLYKKFREQRETHKQLDSILTDIQEGDIKCIKHGCKGRKCMWYQRQIRSGDEGMTTFYICLTCGKRWKN